MTVRRGDSRRAYLKVQNDGIASAAFVLKGTGGATGFVVHYYRGSTNITSAVRGGTYATANIAPRAYAIVRIVVSVGRSSASHATFTTAARSTAGTPHDAVRFAVEAS